LVKIVAPTLIAGVSSGGVNPAAGVIWADAVDAHSDTSTSAAR